jgi:hypothetical protein
MTVGEKEKNAVRIPEFNQNQKPCVWVTNGDKLVDGGIPSPKNKVAIVGFAPSSMTDVRPYFSDPSFEIWGINQLYIAFPAIVQAATRWFQIHTRREYDTALRDHNHHDWLAGGGKVPHKNNFPIYMQDPVPKDIPLAIPFPAKEITDYFGRYFTNSISWEIALAIYETVKAREIGLTGFTDIFIFGVDMATGEEYMEQRPSCELFIGWAKGLGINVYIPAKSDLCKTMWLYPFEDESPFKQKIEGRRVELRQRMNNLSAQEQAIHDERISILGALDNMNYIAQTWMLGTKEASLLKGQGLPEPPDPSSTQNIQTVEVPYEESIVSPEPANDGGTNSENDS